MKKILRIAALLVSLVALASHATPPPPAPVSSTIVMPWELIHNQNLPRELKAQGFSHATFYLNWSDIETSKGQYEFAHYHRHLDAIVNGGLSLLLVIDMGGRTFKDDPSQLMHNMSSLPLWIITGHPETAMRDFSGEPTWQPDFTDASIRKYAEPFIAQTIDHFSKRYPGKILGYAIGLQEEHEIKYGQTNYQWRDYKDSTQAAFAKKYNAKQPIINYNNHIAAGVPKAEPLLHAQKDFRETRLQEATCAYASVIRSKGAEAIGYFAETFTSHDAIYSTGIVEKLVPCIDIAVIDFNFYDGYSLVPDAEVLPTLANYMGSLGYKKVMVGAYGEWWESAKKISELVPIIRQTVVQSLAQPHVIGYEIGGFRHQAGGGPLAGLQLNQLHARTAKQGLATAASAKPQINIGILGSTTNFNVWHGERSTGRNIHRDALFASYKILSNEPGMQVHVIGEKNLLADDPIIGQLDAILVPHQAAMPQSIKAKLTAYWKNGGALIQDMRLGEFDENGKPTFDWMHEVFGIANVEWKNRGGVFLIDGKVYRLKPSKRMYTNYASMTPRPGYKVLATEPLQRGHGIMVRGDRTLVFGFMPQLIEDQGENDWRKLFVREIIDVVLRKSGPSSL
ncbi:hypothetical protein ACN9MJ_00345 [Acidovorax facilis]|uniref:beta-galactosidase n=1 Tax=Acidovorax facilis TaxID=12917 RepID=UPI003CEF7C97